MRDTVSGPGPTSVRYLICFSVDATKVISLGCPMRRRFGFVLVVVLLVDIFGFRQVDFVLSCLLVYPLHPLKAQNTKRRGKNKYIYKIVHVNVFCCC